MDRHKRQRNYKVYSSMVNERKFSLELPISQIDIILKGLGELPAKESFSVITEIHSQVKPQLEPKEPIK